MLYKLLTVKNLLQSRDLWLAEVDHKRLWSHWHTTSSASAMQAVSSYSVMNVTMTT